MTSSFLDQPRIFTRNIIGMIILAIMLLVLGGLYGCTTPGKPMGEQRGMTGTVTDVAAAAVLLDAYVDAKLVLFERMDSLPEHTVYALVDLESQIDQLVSDYQAIAQQPASLDFIDGLVSRTSVLYTAGKVLVQPHMATMSMDEQMRLRRLDTAWSQTEATYQRWRADPVAQDRAALLESGLNFATALMLILGV